MHEWIGLPNSTPCYARSGLDDWIAAFAFAALRMRFAIAATQRGKEEKKGEEGWGERREREEENQP